jgi:hypothetical protein
MKNSGHLANLANFTTTELISDLVNDKYKRSLKDDAKSTLYSFFSMNLFTIALQYLAWSKVMLTSAS